MQLGHANQELMNRTYIISKMTCKGCVTSITNELEKVKGVTNIDINLDKAEAIIQMKKPIPLKDLKFASPKKYAISEKATMRSNVNELSTEIGEANASKFQQLKPLLLIFLYLFAAVFLLNFKDWDVKNAMLDFMGLFYIVFSFFKLLDLKGFPESFQMYDPLARRFPIYGWLYPFIEIVLGLLFLMRYQLTIALIITIIILGITTMGVAKTLLNKKKIRCACLGTALKLPMTEATLIENSLMLLMAMTMLFLA